MSDALVETSLLRRGTSHLSLQVFQAGTGLAIGILLARVLGVYDFGTYSYALTLSAVVTVPLHAGMSPLLMREAGTYGASRRWNHVRGLVQRTLQLAALFACVFGVAVGAAFASGFLTRVHPLLITLSWAGALVLPVVLGNAFRAILTGLGFPILGQSIETLLRGAFFLAVLAVALANVQLSPAVAMLLHFLAGIVAAAWGLWLVRRRVDSRAPSFEDRRWMRSALPLLFVGFAQFLMTQTDTLLLGALGNARDVGIYRAALQLANALLFPALAINAVVSSTSGDLVSTQQSARLAATFQKAQRLLAFGSAATLLIIGMFGAEILSVVYGEEYRGAHLPLVFCAAGQLFNGLSLLSLTLHVFTGDERRLAFLTYAAAGANVALCAALIPSYGASGAAFSAAVSYALLYSFLAISWKRHSENDAARAQRPSFFIIGAPKCGTTSIANWLSGNPGIFLSPNKEPNHFNRDLIPSLPRSLPQYERLFRKAPENTVIGEASVMYLYSEVAVPEILRYQPNALFIVALRNPLEMAVSYHNQEVFNGNEDRFDFWEAWNLQEARAEGREIPAQCSDPKLLQYGPICKTGEQLRRVYEHANGQRVLTVFLEDIRARPAETYQRILAFLGARNDGRHEFEPQNPARQRRSVRLHRMLKSTRVIWRHFQNTELGSLISARYNELNSVEVPARPLRPEHRAALVEYFRRDIELLGSLSGRDLSGWLEATPTSR